MEERFKAFLEEKFATIAPTESAVKFRSKLLIKLLDKAQELKIKGLIDDDLIFAMSIESLGDLDKQLLSFEHREIKTKKVIRKLSQTIVIALAIVAILAITYVVIGAVSSIWHPTWLLIVGGLFAGLIVIFSYIGSKLIKRKKTVLFRILVASSEILGAVFIFLVLQLIFGSTFELTIFKQYSWMTFLVMVILVMGVDTALAFGFNSKTKLINLPIFVEIFGVLLYVMVGIIINNGAFWSKGWVLCLIGVLVAIVEITVCYTIKSQKKNELEEQEIYEEEIKEEQSNFTKWE